MKRKLVYYGGPLDGKEEDLPKISAEDVPNIQTYIGGRGDPTRPFVHKYQKFIQHEKLVEMHYLGTFNI